MKKRIIKCIEVLIAIVVLVFGVREINVFASEEPKEVDVSEFCRENIDSLSEYGISDIEGTFYKTQGGCLMIDGEDGQIRSVGLMEDINDEDFLDGELNIIPNIQGVTLQMSSEKAIDIASKWYNEKEEVEVENSHEREIIFNNGDKEALEIEVDINDNRIQFIAYCNDENGIYNTDFLGEETNLDWQIPERLMEYTYMSNSGDILFSYNKNMTYGLLVIYNFDIGAYVRICGDFEINEIGNLVITDKENGTPCEVSLEELGDGTIKIGISEETTTIKNVSKEEFEDAAWNMYSFINLREIEEDNCETTDGYVSDYTEEYEETYDINNFIGVTGSYFSTSGGSERGIGMEFYDSGNGNVSITFKSITHNGVVSAQGIVTGPDTIEANWNDAQFLLTWTDGGEVTVVRSGSTGYSDIDEFTGYETYINNAYYQVG